MNFQQLRSVREAARRGFNLTEVANALHTSQPGVSRQIRELEEELGVAPVGALEFLFKLEASAETGQEFVEVFRATVPETVTPDPVEIIDGRWCTSAEVVAWLARAPDEFTGTFRLIWAQLGAP